MEPGSEEYIVLFSAGIMVLILLSLFGNILVCLAVYHSRNLRAGVNYLIVSLAVSDILIASVAMSIWLFFEITAFSHLSDETSHRLKKAWTFVDILGGIASIVSLTAISFERLWSVSSPLKHRRYMTNLTAGAVIFIVWSYAFTAAGTNYYYTDWKHMTLCTSIIGFFFPLLLIIIAYINIFIIVNRRSGNVISPQDNIRINRTICIIVGLFIICWAPFFVFSIVYHVCYKCRPYIHQHLWMRSFVKWLHYFNSCLNPLIYGIANAQYKDAFKSVFKRLCFHCFFKTQSENNDEATRQMYYPRQLQDTSKALRVELTPEDKVLPGAVGGFRETGEFDETRYLPGDYRALPY